MSLAAQRRYQERFNIAPLMELIPGGEAEKTAELERAIRRSTPLVSNFDDVMSRYFLAFGDKPTIWQYDTDESLRLMQQAIDTNVPIPEPDLSEDEDL